MIRNPRKERPPVAELLDRFGYEDGTECRAAPDGWHAPQDGRCFWCNHRLGAGGDESPAASEHGGAGS